MKNYWYDPLKDKSRRGFKTSAVWINQIKWALLKLMFFYYGIIISASMNKELLQPPITITMYIYAGEGIVLR